jgi:heptosyltransferase I
VILQTAEIEETNFRPIESATTRETLQRILIVRLSAMGDVIHTVPAVRALRTAFPEAHISWLIEERWAELLCAPGVSRRGPRSPARPLVDEIHSVNLKEWGRSPFSLSTLQRVATVWNDLRGTHYDVAIDLQGAIRSAVLARWSGAGAVYGAAEPRESPASLWYTRKVETRGKHVVEQNVSIAQAMIASAGVNADISSCGASSRDDFPRDSNGEARIVRWLAGLGECQFAILNPGAGWGAKRWPPQRYGDVARGLAIMGLRPLLNYGPGEEELVRQVEAASGGTAQAITCSITELIALIRKAKLFIGGDTGPLHLAAAMQVPVVGIYGPTDPARNGPYATRSIVLRSPESVTSHSRRPLPDEGLLAIQSDAVLAAATSLLAGDVR